MSEDKIRILAFERIARSDDGKILLEYLREKEKEVTNTRNIPITDATLMGAEVIGRNLTAELINEIIVDIEGSSIDSQIEDGDDNYK